MFQIKGVEAKHTITFFLKSFRLWANVEKYYRAK